MRLALRLKIATAIVVIVVSPRAFENMLMQFSNAIDFFTSSPQPHTMYFMHFAVGRPEYICVVAPRDPISSVFGTLLFVCHQEGLRIFLPFLAGFSIKSLIKWPGCHLTRAEILCNHQIYGCCSFVVYSNSCFSN